MTDILAANHTSGHLLPTHNKFPAGEGIEWLKQAWELFKKDFIIWLVLMVVWLIAIFIISFIPFIGSLAVSLATPAVIAGFFYAAHQAHQGKKVQFEDVFYGFKNKLEPLLILGAIQLGFYIALALVAFFGAALGGVALFASAAADSSASMLVTMALAAVGTLFLILISIPFSMAMLYAPLLVLFHDMTATQALSRSFKACLSNWLPWLLFSIVVMVLFMLSALTLFVGAIVIAVLCVISVYLSYRAVFLKA
jgi:hypothetical protein